MAPPINTPGNETCPFYDAVKKKLYFSSDFLPGLGGFDNFCSTRTDSYYATPINLGYPLNSPANDLYPVLDSRTMIGYFTSNRVGSFAKKGETCCNDIYRFSYAKPAEPIVIAPPKDTMTVAMKRITSLREKLPIRLYFHNDEPNPRTTDTLTRLDYAQTYNAYKALVSDYHKEWKGNEQGTEAIDGFFRDEVDHGFAQLNDFIALLEQALNEGQRIELQVRGFASPLAKTDYNKNLSLRRIQSMINYLRKVDNGMLLPYLNGSANNGGALTIVKSPFGEDKSASGVSDVLEDLKNSVYSVGASSERRIEIEQVILMAGGDVHDVREGNITHDFGTFDFQQAQTTTFTLLNSGTAPLLLTSARADCSCTEAQLPQVPIPPGSTGQVVVTFNGHARAGPISRSVMIGTDGDPVTFRLTITGTMLPMK